MLALVTEINIATYKDIVFLSEKWLALCDPVHAVCVDRLFLCAGALHNLPHPAVPPISTTANFSTSPTSSVQTVQTLQIRQRREAFTCSKFAKGLVPERITQAPLVDFTDKELQSLFLECSGDYM